MARTKKQKTEPNSSVTPQELQRGIAFAAWLTSAIQAAGTNPHQLSLKQGMPSSTYLYWFLDNGISNAGEYKRPSESMVKALATELRADVNDGLRASGYEADKTPAMVSELANLPLDIQYDIADLMRKFRGAVSIDIAVSPRPSLKSLPKPESYYVPELVTLPILGFAGAVGEGFNIFAEEHQEGELSLPSRLIKNNPPERCFIIQVRGSCLAGSAIIDGDFAVCVTAETARDGDIVLVTDGDDAILKRYREDIEEGGFVNRWLETDEADGEHRFVHTSMPRIMGRMIALHREM